MSVSLPAFCQPFESVPQPLAFEQNYEIFLRYLKKAMSDAAGGVFLPYTSIVQSSGWGKTRLVFEFCFRCQVPCLYLCLRQDRNSGYPPSSSSTTTILGNLRRLNACYARELFRTALWLAYSDSTLLLKLMRMWTHHSADMYDEFWLRVDALAIEWDTRPSERPTDARVTELIKSQRVRCGLMELEKSAVNALFVFDEARALLGNVSDDFASGSAKSVVFAEAPVEALSARIGSSSSASALEPLESPPSATSSSSVSSEPIQTGAAGVASSSSSSDETASVGSQRTEDSLSASMFLATRRALRTSTGISLNFKMFVVYMDTFSKLANFSPITHLDSSSARMGKFKLLNPFTAITNHPWLFSVQSVGSASSLQFDPRFFGRPLWRAELRSAQNNMRGLLDFAVRKLIRSEDKSLSELDPVIRFRASIAVVCSCLGMSPASGSEIASLLVASHMVHYHPDLIGRMQCLVCRFCLMSFVSSNVQATCVGISQDRAHVFSKYPTEPMLNMAALKVLHENTDFVLADAKQAFARSDLGPSSECVAQLLCLLAAKKPSFDDTDPSTQFGDQASINSVNTPLHVFLSKFFGVNERPQPRRSARISGHAPAASESDASSASASSDTMAVSINAYFGCADAEIRLTHFAPLDHLPQEKYLKFHFEMGSGLLLPIGNSGTDAAIVVRLRMPDSTYRYTLLAIQVKNVIGTITDAAMSLLHEKMTVHTLLSHDQTDDNSFWPCEAGDKPDESADAASVSTFVASTSSTASSPRVGSDSLPFLRLVMKTRMSVAEAKRAAEQRSYLDLARGKGIGVVRGLPRWLTAAQQTILNGMLFAIESRSQLPPSVCDPDLVTPIFESLHESAAQRQMDLLAIRNVAF